MDRYKRGYVDAVWNGHFDDQFKGDKDYARGYSAGLGMGVQGIGNDPEMTPAQFKKLYQCEYNEGIEDEKITKRSD